MNNDFSDIVRPASKKPYTLPKEGEKLPLGGITGSRKCLLPGEEKDSKLKAAWRALGNVVRYGNSAGMPRLATDERRKQIACICAIAAAIAATSYGTYKVVGAVSNNMQQRQARALERYMRNVPADQRADAEEYFNMTNDVKMVDYDLSEGKRISGFGPFGAYQSVLTEDYDMNRDGFPDFRVKTLVDTDLFGGYGEGDVADEVHGSWKYYAHPMSGVAREVSDNNGSIENLHTGKTVDFSGGKMESEGM